MAAARPATWRRYAFALVVWLNFLSVFGRSFDEATARDVEAFKDWRLTDPRNGGGGGPASLRPHRAAPGSLFGRGAGPFRRVQPRPTPAGRPRAGAGGGGARRRRAGGGAARG